jgi:AMIN domain
MRLICAAGRARFARMVAAGGGVWLLVTAGPTYGQEAPATTATIIRSIQATAAPGDEVTLVLEFDRAIVRPRSAALTDPPRVYVDLAGVDGRNVAFLPVAPTKDSLLRGTRLAIRSLDPPVTRVVFDLTIPSAYRLDTTGLSRGKVVVVLGGVGQVRRPPPAKAEAVPVSPTGGPHAAAAAAPPTPDKTLTVPQSNATAKRTPAPGAVTPAVSAVAKPTVSPSTKSTAPLSATSVLRSTAQPPAPVPVQEATPAAVAGAPVTPRSNSLFRRSRAGAATPSRDEPVQMEAYAALVATAVERLQALRPVLVSIDRRSEISADLGATASEFDAIGRLLGAIKPQPAREATHGLLVRTCALGARAARLLQTATQTRDESGQWNAASAAAGALILLDRAAKDLAQ